MKHTSLRILILTMTRIAPAVCLIVCAGPCWAAEVFSPPSTWNGTREGSTDGNPAMVDGTPTWRFDGIFPDDAEEPDNYQPLPWTKGAWQNPKVGQSHDAKVKEGAVIIGMYGQGGGNLEFRKNNSLAFIAPNDGKYALSTTIDIFRWEGQASVTLRLFKRENRNGGWRLTRIKNLPLEIKKGNVIKLDNLELRKNAELIILPYIDGYYSGASATLNNLVISREDVPGGVAEKVAAPIRPTYDATMSPGFLASGNINFPVCNLDINATKDGSGVHRPGLHAGHPCTGVIDVTKPPYNADNTGQTDVSDILTRALLENKNSGWGNRIVYLPNGTCLVAKTVKQTEGGGNVGPCLQGQSRKGTIIRLKDGTWPTDDGKRRWILKTGDGVAQNFNRILRNLTISIGKNNDGACGLFFYGNNQASMSDVDVISEDGKGQVGLDLGDGAEQGPCLVRNTYVKGFKTGVRCAALNAVTIHNLSLEGQSQVGILHTGHPLWVHGLTSVNQVPAVSCADRFLLINGSLTGGDAASTAIKHNGGVLFVRNVSVGGYGKAIESQTVQGAPLPAGPKIDEFCSHQTASLFGPPQHSLNLPIKDPPEPAWEQDMSKWASVESYKGEGLTDAEALQAAIDDKRNTTLCLLANVRITRSETVFVRGNISRIIGTGGALIGAGSLVFGDGGPPVVKVERMALPMNSYHRSNRTVVIEAVTGMWFHHEGGGDLFVSDACIHMKVSNPSAHLWMWHFNSEGQEDALTVKEGTAWVFGWKTEGVGGRRVVATGGTLEMLGFLDYTGGTDKSAWPLMDLRDTRFSIAGLSQTTFTGEKTIYHRLVKETRGGVTKELTKDQSPGGYSLPLYTSGSGDATPSAERPAINPAPRSN